MVVSFMSKKRSNNNYYREIDKDNYINNYNSIKAGIQGDNKKSEVTQKYDRTNYDDSKAKERHKDKVYGDNKTTTDKYTGKTIHRDHKAAKN